MFYRLYTKAVMLIGGLIIRKASSFRSIMSPRKPSHPFTIFVEGNIGSGKTTFLQNFAKSDVCVLAEPVDLWRNVDGKHNLFAMMYQNPSRWSLTFQTYVQLTMLDLHTSETKHPFKLMERSIYSARYCFVENLVKSGVMDPAEFAVLDEWFNWIISSVKIDADLIVYLRTTPQVVYNRIQARARKEEKQISVDYLQDLHNLHEEWLYRNSQLTCPAPVVVLDANQNMDDMEEDIKKCKSIILQKDLVGIGKMCHQSASLSA